MFGWLVWIVDDDVFFDSFSKHKSVIVLGFVFRFFCFPNNQKTNREHWLIDWSINLMTIFVTIDDDDDDDYRLFLHLSNNHDDDDSNNHLFCFNLIFWSIVCLCVWRFPFLFMSALVFGFYFYLEKSFRWRRRRKPYLDISWKKEIWSRRGEKMKTSQSKKTKTRRNHSTNEKIASIFGWWFHFYHHHHLY